MSANSSQIVNRANESSPYFTAIKQRSSNAGLRGNAFLYSSEINTVPQARSKVRIVSTTNPGFSRTMRIPLSRHGMLQRLVLHATWSGHAVTPSSASNAIHSVPNLGVQAFTEMRIVIAGQVISRLDPYGVITDIYCNASNEDLPKHQILLHAYDSTKGSETTANCVGDKDGLYSSQHWAAGDVHTYFDMGWWFAKRQNLALDLGVLANQVYLEVDVDSQANCFSKTGTATLPDLGELEVIQYITELSPQATRDYRAAQYSIGAPMTQLIFGTTHSIVASSLPHTANPTPFSVRLNAFSQQVKKLIIFATNADDFATNGHRLRPVAMKNLKIKASGTEIWELEDMDNKEQILESVINGTRWTRGANTDVGAVVAGTNKVTFAHGGDVAYTTTDPTATQETAVLNAIFEELRHSNSAYGNLKEFSFDPQNVYCVDFSSIYDYSKVSANGSADFAQLNSPELSGEICSVATDGYNQTVQAHHGSTSKVDIHVIAYNETLLSYITNSAGSTTLKSISS